MNTTVKFDGNCAFALSLGKQDVMGSGNSILLMEGNEYHFSNPVAKLLFRLLPNRIQKAEAHWALNKQMD